MRAASLSARAVCHGFFLPFVFMAAVLTGCNGGVSRGGAPFESASRFAPHTDAPANEEYARSAEQDFHSVRTHPLSTFAVDVDTASYSNIRRFLQDEKLPPAEAVRVEEMINYFHYDYRNPEAGKPLAVTTELGNCPWRDEHRLLLVGLQSRSVHHQKMPARNLVFLIDVSGSMEPQDKLPLVKRSLRRLVSDMREQDSIGIVTYAGEASVALSPTCCSERNKEKILRHIQGLTAGGSTNGEAGIQTAYRLCRENLTRNGINRVILTTDGDFNVGVSSNQGLTELITGQKKTGVFLTVIGVGTGNLKDHKLETLANRGNGHYVYLDSSLEARKALGRELSSTLMAVAKDVKIQVEFNPAHIRAYRLIGYENRSLKAKDFNDDKKDAGEVGAGHRVTALYEIVPTGATLGGDIDPLRYSRLEPKQSQSESEVDNATAVAEHLNELAFVKVRYKRPDQDHSRKLSVVVPARLRGKDNLRLASAVAAFGLLLGESKHTGKADWKMVEAMVKETLDGDGDHGQRHELLKLVRLAKELNAGG